MNEKMQTKKAPQKKEIETKRLMKGTTTIYHDLFRLEPANMIKEVMIGSDKVLKEAVQHQHFYHTVDSSGRRQYECAPIGGHVHKIEVGQDENGNLIATCGVPLVRTTVKTKFGKRIEKILPSKDDNHTHICKYIESSEIKPRKANEEALKAMSFFQNPDFSKVESGQQD
jgi:hypothetical protein